MDILGISCFYHDAAACLLRDGKLIAAASEERFSRKKHDFSFPKKAIAYCLREGGIGVQDLAYVGFYDKPFLKFERIMETYLSVAPRGFRSFMQALPLWMNEKLWSRGLIKKELGYKGEVIFTEHHESHAASSFFMSPFERAAILTLDGVGEWTTTARGWGERNRIHLTHEIKFPHSLGLLYSAFTYYLGFKVNSGEYKVMGAAPYGEPRFYDLILGEFIDLKEDGTFKLNMDYFGYLSDLKMINHRFEAILGRPPRVPETWIEQHYFDVAASIQKVTEEVMLRMARHLHGETGLRALCLAGGVALNCVANARVLRESPFEEVFIQPASGDAGGAVGVAAFIWYSYLGNSARIPMKDAYLGPAFGDEEIRTFLDGEGIPYEELPERELLRETARLIAGKNVVGWFQGRMEFGPRALGSRSILADARDPEMQKVVNLRIKFRESFRPFAPTVLLDRAADYFEIKCPSPYMLLTARVREDRRVIPAVTHQDGSARLQTVSREDNPRFYDLIAEYEKLAGVPVIINTSFNVRGEPIVCTPQEAFACFMRTEMDYLVMGNFLLDKKRLEGLKEKVSYEQAFELD